MPTFGFGGAILDGSDPFTLFINRVNVTSPYLKANTMSIRLPLEGRGSADFVTSDHAGLFRPQIGQDVIYLAGVNRLFGGRIQETTETFTPGTNVYMEIKVQALSYTFLLDRRIVGKYYDAGGALSTWQAQVADIVASYLAVDGVTFDSTYGPTDSQIGKVMIFDYVTATDAMNQIAAAIGAVWQVDNFKVLKFIDFVTPHPAPISLADNDHQWVNMQVLRIMTNYRNRQAVKPSKNILNIWTDSFTGLWPFPAPSTGSIVGYLGTYILSYIPKALPQIQVNGVPQKVVFLLPGPLPPVWDFYLIGQQIQRNFSYAPLTNADIIDVEYESPLPGVFWVIDQAEVTARQAIEGGTGLYESLDSPANVEDADTALTDAAGLLEKYGKMLETISVDLPKQLPSAPMILPGQILTINTTRPLVNGSFVIDTTDVKEVDKTFLKWTLSVGDHKMRVKGYKYFTKLKQALSRPRDRITQTAEWTLAGTINGITNPGLAASTATALPPGIVPYTVVKFGTYASATIFFQTAPVSNDVVVDIVNYDTGASIFGPNNADKLVFPVSGKSVVLQLFFKTNPAYCNVGDRLVPVILVADVTAMDGLLDLVMFA